MTQSEELHDAFASEDEYEDRVDPLECGVELLRLVVMLDGHRHHVEQDDDHDEYVELLARRHLEEQQLQLDLKHDNYVVDSLNTIDF